LCLTNNFKLFISFLWILFENKELKRIFRHRELPQALLYKRKMKDRSYIGRWETSRADITTETKTNTG
jgi:hypothetical protein